MEVHYVFSNIFQSKIQLSIKLGDEKLKPTNPEAIEYKIRYIPEVCTISIPQQYNFHEVWEHPINSKSIQIVTCILISWQVDFHGCSSYSGS